MLRLCRILAAAALSAASTPLPLHQAFTTNAHFAAAAAEAPSNLTTGAPLLNLYGRVINSNSPQAVVNFTGFLASGSSTFAANSSDLANIYDSPDDYDTWRQSVPIGATSGNFTGGFVYHYLNNTDGRAMPRACMALAIDWVVGFPAVYDCNARILAEEYDCHTSWGVTTECSFDPATNMVTAVWSVVNLGPDGMPPYASVLLKRRLVGGAGREAGGEGDVFVEVV